MTTKFVEGPHKGEFLLSEGNGRISREVGTLASGHTLVDGQVVSKSGSNLIPHGVDSDSTIVGVAFGNYDSTAGALGGVVYVARLAEVDSAKLTFDTAAESEGADTAVKTALAALNIIAR